MVSVCTVPARGGRSCEHFGGYKTINRMPLYRVANLTFFGYFQNISFISNQVLRNGRHIYLYRDNVSNIITVHTLTVSTFRAF